MLARLVRVTPPIVLLLGGVVLGYLVPALATVRLPPEVVLLLFLPALLYWEALNTSLREIRSQPARGRDRLGAAGARHGGGGRRGRTRAGAGLARRLGARRGRRAHRRHRGGGRRPQAPPQAAHDPARGEPHQRRHRARAVRDRRRRRDRSPRVRLARRHRRLRAVLRGRRRRRAGRGVARAPESAGSCTTRCWTTRSACSPRSRRSCSPSRCTRPACWRSSSPGSR